MDHPDPATPVATPVVPDAPARPAHWPATIRATWTDPGYTRAEIAVLLGLGLGFGWAVLVVLAGQAQRNWLLLLLPAAVLGWTAFSWRRRTPATITLELGPDALRVTREGTRPADVTLPRDGISWLVATAATAGSSERIILLLDEPGNELVRFRALPVPVTVAAPDDEATRAWWAATMPEGTTPSAPPAVLAVTPLLGDWWPAPERRIGLKGSGQRIPWVEPAVREWPRRAAKHRRNVALVLGGLMVALLALAVRAGTPAALAAVVPPALAGLVAAVAGYVRGR